MHVLSEPYTLPHASEKAEYRSTSLGYLPTGAEYFNEMMLHTYQKARCYTQAEFSVQWKIQTRVLWPIDVLLSATDSHKLKPIQQTYGFVEES